jgi:hypothetical protein
MPVLWDRRVLNRGELDFRISHKDKLDLDDADVARHVQTRCGRFLFRAETEKLVCQRFSDIVVVAKIQESRNTK